MFFFKKNEIFYIGGSDSLPPPLEAEEEIRAINGCISGNKADRDLLIEHNLRLVVYIAKRFENTGVNVEDMISIGTIGLIKAINTFKIEKNIKLATYASRCIENEILMYLRRISKSKGEVSLDEPLNVDWDGNELLLSDILGTENDEIYGQLEEEVNRNLLGHAMKKLSLREKEILQMRFGLAGGNELTQKEVADIMGISQSYISRLEKKIIGRLRKEIKKLG
jgi:RNA polymerase sporulation-specific sigma factor